MILQMSTLFLRTQREDPADAEVASHRLLLRAGFVRRVSPGIFTMLPLGLRVQRRIEELLRQEMVAVGAQELLFPALLPRKPFEDSGRWDEYGATLFRLQDRRKVDLLLGPTHEEFFTLAVKDLYSSYKDLPVTLFQIQAKYRDEARPRAGILRGREFVMKDSYSFDLDDAGLDRSYDSHRAAYVRALDRMEVDYVICSAMTGPMGGSASEEFMAVSAVGEDTIVRCPNGDFAANVEALRTPTVPPRSFGDVPPVRRQRMRPCHDGSSALFAADSEERWPADHVLRTELLTVVDVDGSREALALGVPDDRDIDLKRIDAQLAPAEARPMTKAEREQLRMSGGNGAGPLAPGPTTLSGVRYLVDPRVAVGTEWVIATGEDDVYEVHVVCGRDFEPDGVIEAVSVRNGDPCPVDGAPLEVARGIEIAHVFKLGQKYAKIHDLAVRDESGAQVTVTMGSYGMGVTRAMGTVAEQHADEKGLCWPAAVAPADVHVVGAGRTLEIAQAAERLAGELSRAGLVVLLDDRAGLSPGVRFKDAELIGIPTAVIVGRSFEHGLIEVRDRRSGSTTDVPVGQLVQHVRDRVPDPTAEVLPSTTG